MFGQANLLRKATQLSFHVSVVAFQTSNSTPYKKEKINSNKKKIER